MVKHLSVIWGDAFAYMLIITHISEYEGELV